MMPKYLVTVLNGTPQEFNNINSAMDYASRLVYMAPKHGDMCRAALRGGQSYSYEYGFANVELVATAKEIPICLIEAAPELLAALKSLLSEYQALDKAATLRGCGDNYSAHTIAQAECAIRQAEGNEK